MKADRWGMSAPISLISSCQFVTGAKCAAIYDLENNNVFSLNETAKNVIEGNIENTAFVKELKKIGLINTNSIIPPKRKKFLTPAKLDFMWLELTSKCNLRCLHCYAKGEINNNLNNSDLDTKFWEKIIKEGSYLNCHKMQFIGGEPFLRKDLFNLADYAKENGYEFIEVFTNGTLLSREKIKTIKNLGLNIAISIYSYCQETHESITRVKNSFKNVLKNLEILKEEDVPTRVAVIIMKQNQGTITRTLNFLKRLGIASRPDVVRPTGDNDFQSIMPCMEVLKKWCFVKEPNFSTSYEDFYYNQNWNSCWVGKIAITSNGNVIPCIFARNHVVGKLSDSISLTEVIKNKDLQYFWKITKDDVEVCKDCEYRYVCRDCRPLAEATYRDLFAKSPRCKYNPYKGVWEGGEIYAN